MDSSSLPRNLSPNPSDERPRLGLVFVVVIATAIAAFITV
jgi:hypothetical protein